MSRVWAYLDPKERDTFRTAVAFLRNRLAEEGTINWALALKLGQRTERLAIAELINGSGGRELSEPWITAWRLIEESWSTDSWEQGDQAAVYSIQQRLKTGDRSGALVAAIVALVEPRLKLEPISSWRRQNVKQPRAPKRLEHLLSARLTSGDIINLHVLELTKLDDIPFLTSLASALDAAVIHGLDIGRRLGWDGQRRLWQLGDLGRVYYAYPNQGEEGSDPDAYHTGIAPSVKLLHAVVSHIANLQLTSALPFVDRWRTYGSAVHLRLWAAMSRDPKLTPPKEVSVFMSKIDDEKFWNLNEFPEVAELRALRFNDLEQEVQNSVCARIQKGPPRSFWPRSADTMKVSAAREYDAVRELRRIEVAGGRLPPRSKAWLDPRLSNFADLKSIAIDAGFPSKTTSGFVPPNPDDQYNTLEGASRLRALEAALSTPRSWDDDPAGRANDWINRQGNPTLLRSDFETTGNGGDEFPRVWNRFGWAHRPDQLEGAADQLNLTVEAERVLTLLVQLSDSTIKAAIEGISAWLDTWAKQVVASPLGLPAWLRAWPFAVDATNSRPEVAHDVELKVTGRAVDDDREVEDLDTLNPPAGKLVGVFLTACPNLGPGSRSFLPGSVERQMRDAVIAAPGRSGLIARHRLTEVISYFLHADDAWAQEHLIAPLLTDDAASLALWRAIARRTHFESVLAIIGGAMAERATDRRLGRQTRRNLVFSLVVETLYAFKGQREPAVPNPRIQQMLRTLDDEVRASAANVIQQFVRELSAKQTGMDKPEGDDEAAGESAARLFKSAAEPFLREVWPQERSLATPGVARALADLPAASGEAFVAAVDTIERFLIPFDCWSMGEYGLYAPEGGQKKLASINSDSKAKALLRLLDLTVGTSEGAVVPHDITDALDQIRSVAPILANSPAFQRLATAARR